MGPPVHSSVQACGIVGGPIQLGRVVRTCSVGIERYVGKPREEQRTGSAEMGLDGWGEQTAEEDCAVRIDIQ
jgi:hypothetical protein